MIFRLVFFLTTGAAETAEHFIEKTFCVIFFRGFRVIRGSIRF
jgi:hypothetical protein